MKNADKPAYPVEVDVEGVPKDSGTYERLMEKARELGNGLTKRERFAMAAMQGFCANPEHIGGDAQDISEWAIAIADELLNKLEDNEHSA